MNWVDTHAHIYFDEMNMSLPTIIDPATQQGVSTILMPCVDMQCTSSLLDVAEQYPTICLPMLGLHPCYVGKDYAQELDGLSRLIAERRKDIVAIGEIGLDFYHDTTFVREQEEALAIQLAWADEYQLPISVHARNATERAWEMIDELFQSKRGVFHCYSGDYTTAKSIVEKGMYLGIGGSFTYPKNESLRDIVKAIGLRHIVLETDSPYLSPVPFRGKTNQPSYIPTIGKAIAEALHISVEEVAEITTANAKEVFAL